MRRLTTFTTGLVALVVTGSAAAGGSTIVSGYDHVAGTPVGKVLQPNNAGQVAGTVHSSGTLPFTGLSLVGFAAAAILLIVIGFALNRASRRGNQQA